jgi:hypothetical protein
VTDVGGHCSFCGATRGPFAKVEGLFTVLICIPCLEVRQAQPSTRLGRHDPGPYPLMTRGEVRESLELLPSWVRAQKAAANRQLITVMRQRLAAGEQVAPDVSGAGAGLAGMPSRGGRAAPRRAASVRAELMTSGSAAGAGQR